MKESPGIGGRGTWMSTKLCQALRRAAAFTQTNAAQTG
jgi:hypothetical protein